MRFEFLTPEIFDMLVIANLIVALALIAYRFTRDMSQPVSSDQRQQSQDEISTSALEDTTPNNAISFDEQVSPAQQQQS